MKFKKLQRSVYLLLFCCFVGCVILGLLVLTPEEESHNSINKINPVADKFMGNIKDDSHDTGKSQLLQKIHVHDTVEKDILNERKDKMYLQQMVTEKKNIANRIMTNLRNSGSLNYKVHIFYYMWYGSPEYDKQYFHWNHQRIPHWNKEEAKKWPQDQHIPPDDIGSNFYPELGPYSSQDPYVIRAHMKQISYAGIGRHVCYLN